MKVLAQVVKTLDVISGQSDNGNFWEKQTIIVDTLELEPKRLAIEYMGERKTKITKGLKAGEKVEVAFAINCREYMDKWYTRLDGIYCRPMETKEEPPAEPTATPNAEMPPTEEPAF